MLCFDKSASQDAITIKFNYGAPLGQFWVNSDFTHIFFNVLKYDTPCPYGLPSQRGVPR